jgi:hypothetical protein
MKNKLETPKNTECSWSNDVRPVFKIFVDLSLSQVVVGG